MFVKFGKKKKNEKKRKPKDFQMKSNLMFATSSAKNVMMQQMAEKARKMKKFHLREHLASN